MSGSTAGIGVVGSLDVFESWDDEAGHEALLVTTDDHVVTLTPDCARQLVTILTDWTNRVEDETKEPSFWDDVHEDDREAVELFLQYGARLVVERMSADAWDDDTMDEDEPLTILTPEQATWLAEEAAALNDGCDSKPGTDRWEYSMDSNWYGGASWEFRAAFGLWSEDEK